MTLVWRQLRQTKAETRAVPGRQSSRSRGMQDGVQYEAQASFTPTCCTWRIYSVLRGRGVTYSDTVVYCNAQGRMPRESVLCFLVALMYGRFVL